MSNLIPFNYQEKQVRTIVKDGEPWFVAKDICDILEIGNANMAAARLDDDEVSQTEVTDNLGRLQKTNIINEVGLYNLILRSDKPESKPFRKWVTGEVLPSIRKHGMYAKDELLDNPDLLIEVATKYKEERQRRLAAEQTIEHQKPKVLFADSVTASSTSILVADLAKILKKNGIEIGEIRLWKWLRDKGYAIKEKGRSYNMPTQKSMDLEVMDIKEGTNIDARGESHIVKTTLVTGKGQVYFVNKFLGIKEVN